MVSVKHTSRVVLTVLRFEVLVSGYKLENLESWSFYKIGKFKRKGGGLFYTLLGFSNAAGGPKGAVGPPTC